MRFVLFNESSKNMSIYFAYYDFDFPEKIFFVRKILISAFCGMYSANYHVNPSSSAFVVCS